MHDTVATFHFGERDRVVVAVDDWPHECPVEWNPSDCGILTVRAARNYPALSIGSDSDAAKQRMQYADEYDTETRHGQEPYHAALRYLRRQGYAADYFSLTGYGQGDWMDVIIWAREETPELSQTYLESLADTIEQWFRGDIYCLHHERLVEYVRADNRDAEAPDLTDWEHVDSLGGCYLDPSDEDEVVSTIRDHFTLPTLAN